MRFTAAEIARVVGGELAGSGDVVVDGAAIDSRADVAGRLFVPVLAARDGHEFVAAAVAAGAPAYLSSRGPLTAAATGILVADTAQALARLGAAARDQLPERVIGITGSVGKTTTKDLAAAVLRRGTVVAAAPGSFNNELGVPLTLLDAPDDTGVSVVEMGARSAGHIAELCTLARPSVGVVTRVAPAHLGIFGSIDAVAAAKSELVEALPPSGTAVLNADDERVLAMGARTPATVLRYSTAGRCGSDLVAAEIELDEGLRPAFRLSSPWGVADVRLAARGAHNVGNALAAAAAALVVGAGLDDVVAGLAAATVSHWRMELRRAPSGLVVINDAYNANPASMRAALESLVRLPAERRVAVLGRMEELGEDGPAEHLAVGKLARSLGVEVIAVGTDDYGPPGVTVDEVPERLAGLGEGAAVLVKASRAVGLERLADRIAPDPAS